jgi:hypothetical protein
MASAEAQLLKAIERKRAQQAQNREVLQLRRELYREQLANNLAKPEYLIGGLCLGFLFSLRQKKNGCGDNEQCKNVSTRNPVWRQIVVDVLDRQLSRLLFEMRRRT